MRAPSAAELQAIADRASSPRVLPRVSMADFAGSPAPERRWIVPGLVPDRNVTDLAGDGGQGKSFIALQLACAMVTATDWFGLLPTPGPVLYLSAEDELDEVRRRVESIVANAAGRFGFPDLADLDVVDLTRAETTELVIGDGGKFKLTPMYDRLAETIRVVRPKLIILDTRADMFGGSEIDRGQVRSFVRSLRRICFECDLAVLMLSHPSLTGMSTGSGQSGSTAWGNSVRSRLYLERPKADDGTEPDPDLRILSTKKANYGTTDGTVALRWHEGVFRLDKAGPVGLDRLAQERAIDDRFIDLLRDFDRQGRTVNNAGGPNYAPKAFAAADPSIGRAQFRAAMERLFAAGTIRTEPFGPPSRNTRKIVAAQQ